MNSFSLNKWRHLVGGEIKEILSPHPLEDLRDKTIFKNQLIKDLGVEEKAVVDISQKKNNLFRIYYKDIFYNIFVEHTDGGGADQRTTPSRNNKRVLITSTKAFRKLIDNYERVLVIDIYCPLKEDLTPDWENRVYLAIKPNEIEEYKENDVKTSSSRWVSLLDIQAVIKNKNWILNHGDEDKQTVYIVHWGKLTEFFNEEFTYQYVSMFKKVKREYEEIINKTLDREDEELKEKEISVERRLFRDLLINSGRGIKCEIMNCRISLKKVLIASHIRPVNFIKKDREISKEEKLKQISDCNNGFLFCCNHDALFDKFLITFSEEGKIIASNVVEKVIDTFNLSLDNITLEIKNRGIIPYLQYHQTEFKERNGV